MRIDSVKCGHCLHLNVLNYKRSPFELCVYWEGVAITKDEPKQLIKETLEFMRNHLHQIAMILEDDEIELF